MSLDFLQSYGPVQLILLAMLLVLGGIVLVFVLTAARRARQDVLNEERDRRDD